MINTFNQNIERLGEVCITLSLSASLIFSNTGRVAVQGMESVGAKAVAGLGGSLKQGPFWVDKGGEGFLFVLLAVIYIIYYPLFSLGRITKINNCVDGSPRSAIVINSIQVRYYPLYSLPSPRFDCCSIVCIPSARARLLIWKICP